MLFLRVSIKRSLKVVIPPPPLINFSPRLPLPLILNFCSWYLSRKFINLLIYYYYWWPYYITNKYTVRGKRHECTWRIELGVRLGYLIHDNNEHKISIPLIHVHSIQWLDHSQSRSWDYVRRSLNIYTCTGGVFLSSL